MQNITQKEFVKYALEYGLCFIASPWNKTLDEVKSVLSAKKEQILASAEWSKVTGNEKTLKRIKPNGNESRLDLLGSKVYRFEDFWLVRFEDKESSHTVIYA